MKLLMHKAFIFFFIVLPFLLIQPLALCAADYKVEKVVLLQPESSLIEKDPDVKAVSLFIEQAKKRFADTIAAQQLDKTAGYVFFAVREGYKTNVWLDFKPELPKKVEEDLLKSLKSVRAFDVKKGTMIFAISFAINGAGPRTDVPIPKEWKAAAAKEKDGVDVETLVYIVWP